MVMHWFRHRLRRGPAIGGKKLNFMFQVYILESQIKSRHYIGHTNNLENRLCCHNAGKVRSTKVYRPWKVVYTEECDTKNDAYKREQQIKSYKGGEAFKRLI